MARRSDAEFLTDRRWRSRFTRRAATALLVVWVAGWIFVAIRVPLLGNPFHLIDRLQRNDVEPGTLALVAGIGSIALQLLGLVTAVFLAALRFWAGLEERYHRMIAEGARGDDSPPGSS